MGSLVLALELKLWRIGQWEHLEHHTNALSVFVISGLQDRACDRHRCPGPSRSVGDLIVRLCAELKSSSAEDSRVLRMSRGLRCLRTGFPSGCGEGWRHLWLRLVFWLRRLSMPRDVRRMWIKTWGGTAGPFGHGVVQGGVQEEIHEGPRDQPERIGSPQSVPSQTCRWRRPKANLVGWEEAVQRDSLPSCWNSKHLRLRLQNLNRTPSWQLSSFDIRLIYYVFPHLDWVFVSVDDFRWILRASNEQWPTPAVLAVLLVLGIPLSWGKTVLSEINKRLGLVISSRSPFVQMARVKHVIVLALLQDVAEAKVFTSKAIEEALGRIQWATATFPLAKPLYTTIFGCGR